MSQKPISELCRRMLEDMVVRRLGEKTKSDYIRHIENFTAFLGRTADTATAEDVRRFQVHLTEIGWGHHQSTRRRRRCVFSLAQRSIGLSSPGISPACTTRGLYRVCCREKRWAVFSKRHPVPVGGQGQGRQTWAAGGPATLGQEGQAGARDACRRAILSAYCPQRGHKQEHGDGDCPAEPRAVIKRRLACLLDRLASSLCSRGEKIPPRSHALMASATGCTGNRRATRTGIMSQAQSEVPVVIVTVSQPLVKATSNLRS